MRIDFHAHILPGMDHGCEDVEMACRQLELARKNGIKLIVATAHFYPHVHTVEKYDSARELALKLLNEHIGKNSDMPVVIPGAEVLACNKLDKMQGLEKLCISGTNIMLLEMPFAKSWDRALVETVIRIHKKMDIQVVLAHADRYSYKSVMELVDNGILLQLNAEAVCNIFKRGLCRRYIKTDKVVALGSDIHGISNAYKEYLRAIKLLGTSADTILRRTQIMLEKYTNG